MTKTRRGVSPGSMILAGVVLAIILGSIAYLWLSPGNNVVRDAGISSVAVKPAPEGPKPFQIAIQIVNKGNVRQDVIVRGSISPADLGGVETIGPIQSGLDPDRSQTVSVPFDPDSRQNYTIRTTVSLADGGVDAYPNDDQQVSTFPTPIVDHFHVTLTIEILRFGGIVRVPIPTNIGIYGGLWANHTLDDWGSGWNAPLHTQVPPDSPCQPPQGGGCIHVESTRQGGSFTLIDFFNIWGQTLTDRCIKIAGYFDRCTGPGEYVVFDTNGNSVYDQGEPVIYGPVPAVGTTLKSDPKIRYVDSNNNNVMDANETVAYDFNDNRGYDFGEHVLAGQGVPNNGTRLNDDSKIMFIDPNGNGLRDPGGTLHLEVDTVDTRISRVFLADGKELALFFVESP